MVSKARIDLEAKDNASPVFAKVQRAMGELDERTSALSEGLGGVTEAFGISGMAGMGMAAALAASVKSTADFNDAMGKAAQRAGVTTEAFSKLAYAAGQSNVTMEELQKGLQLIGIDAATGGKRLSDFGVEIKNLDGSLKTSDQLLREVADRISGMGTPAEKSAAAVNLLGEEGAKLVPLLNRGSQGLNDMAAEAERFGQVVTEEGAVAAAKFNENLIKLQASFSGLVRQMTGELIPALAQVSDDLLEGSKQAGGFWNAVVAFGTINPFRSQENNLRVLRKELAELEADLARPSRLRLNSRGLESDIARVRLQIQHLESQINRPTAAVRPPAATSPAPVLDATTVNFRTPRSTSARQQISEAEKYLQTLQRQLEATSDLTVHEKLLRDISQGRLGRVTEQQREQLFAIADTIAARQAEQELEKEHLEIRNQMRQAVIDEAAAVDAANAKWEGMLQSMVADTSAEKAKRLLEQVQVLDEALAIGRISAEQYAEALAKINEAVPALEQSRGLVDGLGASFSSTFEDAIMNGGRLRDVLNNIAKDIASIAFRRAVTEPLGNALSAFVGRVFSFSGGGYTGNGPRSGGLDGMGGYLAMVHPQETVIDHTKGQRLGVPMVYSPTFNFNGPADQALVLTAAQLGAAMGRQAIYDDMARGRLA